MGDFWNGQGLADGDFVNTTPLLNAAGNSSATGAFATSGFGGGAMRRRGLGVDVYGATGDLRRGDYSYSTTRGMRFHLEITPQQAPTTAAEVYQAVRSASADAARLGHTTAGLLVLFNAAGAIITGAGPAVALVAAHRYAVDYCVHLNTGTPTTSNGRVFIRILDLTDPTWNTDGHWFADITGVNLGTVNLTVLRWGKTATGAISSSTPNRLENFLWDSVSVPITDTGEATLAPYFLWQPTTRVTGTRDTSWAVIQRITATRATTWDVRQGLTATRAVGPWAVTTRVAGSRSTTWAAGARITGTRGTGSWSVAGRLTSTRTTSWDVQSTARVTGTRATTWTTAARVAGTRSSTWAVRSRISNTRTTTWAVRIRLANTRSAGTWSAATRSAGTRAATWSVATRINSTRTTVWSVGGRTGGSRTTSWNVDSVGRVTGTRTTTWNARARTTGARSSSWNTGARIVGGRGSTWTVRSRTTATRSTAWATRSRIGSTRPSSTWSIAARRAGTRATNWAVQSNVQPRDITVTATLGPRRWDATLGSRRYDSGLKPRRWNGALR